MDCNGILLSALKKQELLSQPLYVTLPVRVRDMQNSFGNIILYDVDTLPILNVQVYIVSFFKSEQTKLMSVLPLSDERHFNLRF